MITNTHYQEELLRLHDHLCPRQVLGVRMGELAGRLLGLPTPQNTKRLFVFVETDGCFADGIMVATGCSLGHRTLRLMDYGKVAATFVDKQASPIRAVRMWPNPSARLRAIELSAASAPMSRWRAQLESYQIMPDEALLVWQDVDLALSLRDVISKARVRVACAACGEEIINEREIVKDGITLCRHCAGDEYYRLASGND